MEHLTLSAFAGQGGDHRSFPDVDIVGREVGEVPVLCVAPDVFHGVEVRNVRRQPFDPEVFLVCGKPVLNLT